MKVEEIKATIEFIRTIRDIIKEKGEIPEGELYAILLPYLAIEQFNDIMNLLVESNQIKKTGYLLTYIGE